MTNEFIIRPIYADTDAEGVVYYAVYLAWMEKGRTELIRDTGYSVADLKKEGVIFAVRRAEIDYHASARYDEPILMRTKVVEIKGATITFEHEIINKESGQLLVSGRILLAALKSESLKPTRIPERLTKKFISPM
ncbi:MAG: YbgC/FadM family acyl-CoA thioesterase [Nitrospinae bacterium]|nr:YbgC/FadM family acyl-CoA thioesterase [Nitrospinota bacterium]